MGLELPMGVPMLDAEPMLMGWPVGHAKVHEGCSVCVNENVPEGKWEKDENVRVLWPWPPTVMVTPLPTMVVPPMMTVVPVADAEEAVTVTEAEAEAEAEAETDVEAEALPMELTADAVAFDDTAVVTLPDTTLDEANVVKEPSELALWMELGDTLLPVENASVLVADVADEMLMMSLKRMCRLSTAAACPKDSHY